MLSRTWPSQASGQSLQPRGGRWAPWEREGGARTPSARGSAGDLRSRERSAGQQVRARGGNAGSGPAGGAVGEARAAALGAPNPGSSSRLRSKHGGGGVRGPSGETESGSYAERERRAGLRRRRHCRKTTPTVSAPAAAAAPRAGSAAEVERERSGTRRRGAKVAAFLRLRAA